MLKKIDEIRGRGYAVSIQERYMYTAGVAAPVFIDRTVIGSLAIIGPAERIRAMKVEKIGAVVRRIADQLSTELTNSGNARRARTVTRR